MKKKSKAEKTGRSGIRFDPDLLKQLQVIADAEDRSRNKVMEILLRKAAKDYFNGHPDLLDRLNGAEPD